jgi:hypothetical protein
MANEGTDVKAIVVGIIADVAATFVGGIALGIALLPRGMTPEGAEIWARHSPSLRNFGLVLGLACTVFGGFVTGRVAGRDGVKHGVILGLVLTGLGFLFLIGSEDEKHLPVWCLAVQFGGTLPAAVLGGFLGRTSKQPS